MWRNKSKIGSKGQIGKAILRVRRELNKFYAMIILDSNLTMGLDIRNLRRVLGEDVCESNAGVWAE